MNIQERANSWITGDDTGLSSKCLWAVMMKVPHNSWSRAYPSDGGDLGRCVRLLELIPEWRARLPEMKAVSPYWSALVEKWDELEALLKAETAPGATATSATYAVMKRILKPIEDRDPSVIRLGNGVSVRFGR